jgi:PAS domain S-box-containing protein
MTPLISAILIGAGVVATIAMIFIIIKKTARTDMIQVFLFYLLASLSTTICQFLKVFVHDQSLFSIIVTIELTGVTLMPFTMLYFALLFTGHTHITRRPSFFFALLVPLMVVLYLFWSPLGDPVRDIAGETLYPWGYDPGHEEAPAFAALIASLFIGTGITFTLLIKHYRSRISSERKQQTKLLLIAFALPIVSGTIGQGILPGAFGIHIFPLSQPATALETAIIAYALIRYGLFSLDVSVMSENVVNAMQSGVMAVDQGGRIIFANKAAEKLTRIKRQKLTELSIRQVFDKQDFAHIKETFIDTPYLHNDDATAIESTLTAKRQNIPVNIYGSKYTDQTGEALCTILVFANVTQFKELQDKLKKEKSNIAHLVDVRTEQLEEEKVRFESSINSLPLGYMLTNSSNAIIMLNPAMQKMLGLRQANPDNIEHGSVAKNTLLKSLLEHSQKCLTTNKPAEIKEMHYNSRFFRAFILPVIQDDGHTNGSVLLLEDITEEQILNRAKDEFFSIASHELRTPLTAISGNTSLIKQYFGDQLQGQDLKELIDDIHDSSRRLIVIVNDFLDVSRIEQGKITFNLVDFDVAEVIERAIYEMGAMSSSKKVAVIDEVTLGSLPLVHADKDRVKQVVYNLVGNALKFTDQGSVTVHAETTPTHVKVLVTDTGHGINATNQKLLFRKFQQATSSILTRDSSRGTGLGLYISKMLVEKMKGKIVIEHSELGKGTTFSFTLPISKPGHAGSRK